MAEFEAGIAAEYRLTLRRNDSLGARGRKYLFASLCVVSFGFALGFAAFGAWLVLPYSMLEMAVLYWAFRWFDRHAADWECITITGDRVIVESLRSGTQARWEFNRRWLRIEVGEERFNTLPALAFSYAGRRVPFGHVLTAVERIRVARDLRRLLVA
jgi:uncharacterized membrane protein